MASVTDSAEKLAEIKAEDAKNTAEAEVPATSTEPATEKADAEEGPSTEGEKPSESEDATMDADDGAKALRAVRQSTWDHPPNTVSSPDSLSLLQSSSTLRTQICPMTSTYTHMSHGDFADEGLGSARFMWQLHTANTDHWVPVSTVASFKRMREFSAQGEEWLVSSLRTISSSLEVDAEGKNVRRRTEVTEPKGQFERSVYAVSAVDDTETRSSLNRLNRKDSATKSPVCKKNSRHCSTSTAGPTPCACGVWTTLNYSRCVDTCRSYPRARAVAE